MLRNRLSEKQCGLIALIFGLLLFLYALSIFSVFLNYVMVIVAIGLMGWGFVESGLFDKVKELIQKKKLKKP
jgi:thiamine transporter ThiT